MSKRSGGWEDGPNRACDTPVRTLFCPTKPCLTLRGSPTRLTPPTLGKPRSNTNNRPAPGPFTHFRDFYPFYLSEHRDPTSRRLHVLGTGLVISIVVAALLTQRYVLLWALPLVGYGFAWAGHFFFEKNRPATFRHPFYSLAGDFVMFKDVVTGKIRW